MSKMKGENTLGEVNGGMDSRRKRNNKIKQNMRKVR